jgi:hypothetical protein
LAIIFKLAFATFCLIKKSPKNQACDENAKNYCAGLNLPKSNLLLLPAKNFETHPPAFPAG